MKTHNRIIQLVLCLTLFLTVTVAFGSVSADPEAPAYGELQFYESNLADGATNGRLSEQPTAYQLAAEEAFYSQIAPQASPLAVYQNPFFSPLAESRPQGNEVVCQELLLNTGLNVVTFPDNTGNADPWSEVVEEIYFASGSPTTPDFSLVLIDADADNGEVNDDAATPTRDAFGQGVAMPPNLQEVQIRYSFATVNTNTTDRALGEVWFLTEDGTLETLHGSWQIAESDGVWDQSGFVLINSSTGVESLSGVNIGLLFASETDNMLPGEAAFFDDISLVACYIPLGTTQFLPSVLRSSDNPAPPQPTCILPGQSDTPTERTGRIETGASCADSLTLTDQRDNYIFTPSANGNHVMRLQGVPNASATAFKIAGSGANVSYETVSAAGGGDCRFTTAGADRSKSCVFSANDSYLILIDRGQPANAGDYILSISR